MIIPPQNAATLRLQLWLVRHNGWVAFDDLIVEDLTVAGWDGSTKYYSFNGQRIAMRQGNALAYLHTDALGSTKLVTDQDGNVSQGATRYYAYGREQTPGRLAGLPTDYTFTGQRQDNTGLIYMNARYYDPELGQFISPDTLVPDEINLFDYNRYMYARGNPMRYADPSGHCPAPDKPGGTAEENRSAWEANAKCTALTDTILNAWDKTDYWSQIWPDKQAFQKYVANDPNLDYNFFSPYWQDYQKYEKQWDAMAHRVIVGERKARDGDRLEEPFLCDPAEKDCAAIVYDAIATAGSTLQVLAPGCTIFVTQCALAGTVLNYTGTGAGLVHAYLSYQQGRATGADLTVTVLTSAISLSPYSKAGLGASLFQSFVDASSEPFTKRAK